MKVYAVISSAGTRLWHADNAAHAVEQHVMDFLAEEVRQVLEVECPDERCPACHPTHNESEQPA